MSYVTVIKCLLGFLHCEECGKSDEGETFSELLSALDAFLHCRKCNNNQLLYKNGTI